MILHYDGLHSDDWRAKTEELISKHPINPQEIVEVTLKAWETIFKSSIGGFHIGIDMFPNPQMLGFFIQQLVSLEFAKRYPNIWRGEKDASDKDLVYIPDPQYSIEIKTSSNTSHIFGNRSYGQVVVGKSKKEKNGYYLAVNFQKLTESIKNPKIYKIRFGWLDHIDWLSQKASSGQQARLDILVETGKLLELYPKYSLGQQITASHQYF